ncbi:hypothetical protein HDF19_07445 [Mucilaginibacter sp. E4BP6]|uniref:hypothetical protein n=1 Tax=Mucilaginibacter sp. E4BP6 TaxID=2723089 RepID=UPI0015C7A985|nr:hypothetical protein [Mucilaginibacter sp. E4BP6]NYE67440.1 hypothetical protein [Mucilaginibacter sp. E4BP6]
MKKNSLFLFAALLAVVSFSSCGIFGKGCGCPTFGRVKQNAAPIVIANNKVAAVKAG